MLREPSHIEYVARTQPPHVEKARNIIKTISIYCSVLCAFLAGVILNANTPIAQPENTLARRATTEHIIPAYKNLSARADAFASRTSEYCASPPLKNNDVTKRAHHKAFKSLIHAWAYIEHIRFGPISENNLHDRIHFWPDRKAIGRRQLAKAIRTKNPSVLTPALLQKKSAAMQGLGALEYIFYGSPENRAPSTPADADDAKFRCQFAESIAQNLSNLAKTQILQPWTKKNGYKSTFLNPGDDNPLYLTQDEVNLEIVKSFLNGLQYLRDQRLAGPLGMRKGQRKKARGAFEQSALSLHALRANIEGLRDLFLKSGMSNWIGKLDPGIETTVLNEFTIALKQANKIDLPLRQAVDDPDQRSILISMGFPLKNARDLVLKTLSSHTELPLGMNAYDGD